MNVNITPILESIISLVLLVLTTFFVPWLKSKTTANQRESMLKWVDIAVAMAQQLYWDCDGEKRKEEALKFLSSKGYDVNDEEILSALEAAVLKLHNSLTEEGKK